MIINANDRRVDTVASGSTPTFSFDFAIQDISDLGVYWNGAAIAGLGVIIASHTGVGDESGGTVTFSATPIAGTLVTMIGATPVNQPSRYTTVETLPLTRIEDDLSRAVILLQQVHERLNRTPRFNIGSLKRDVFFDEPDAGKFLRWKDAAGNIDSGVPVSSGTLSVPVGTTDGGTGGNFANRAALLTGLGAALWGNTLTGVIDAWGVTTGVLQVPNPMSNNATFINNALSGITTAGVRPGTEIFLYFSSAIVLTHSSSFFLLGAQDYTTIIDSVSKFLYTGSAWRELGRFILSTATNRNQYWRGDGAWASLPSMSGVQGLTGAPNAGTPDSKYDLSANVVIARDPTLGHIFQKVSTGTLTVDMSVAGPAALGRDQVGVFGANNFIYVYFIMKPDGTCSATASLTAPPTGPALPSGYTAWAYATCLRWNGSSVLIRAYTRGAAVFYQAMQSVLNAGTATVETAVSLSTFVPPSALTASLHCTFNGAQRNDNASSNSSVELRLVTGVKFAEIQQVARNSAGTVYDANIENTAEISIPNVGQSVIYIIFPVSGATPAASILVRGFRISNGDS